MRDSVFFFYRINYYLLIINNDTHTFCTVELSHPINKIYFIVEILILCMLKIKWSTKNNFKNVFQSICVVKKSNIILK